jgi:hypothetical protein
MITMVARIMTIMAGNAIGASHEARSLAPQARVPSARSRRIRAVQRPQMLSTK